MHSSSNIYRDRQITTHVPKKLRPDRLYNSSYSHMTLGGLVRAADVVLRHGRVNPVAVVGVKPRSCVRITTP
jgi:hypothetical protein